MKFLCLMAQNNTVYFKPKDIKDGNCSDGKLYGAECCKKVSRICLSVKITRKK